MFGLRLYDNTYILLFTVDVSTFNNVTHRAQMGVRKHESMKFVPKNCSLLSPLINIHSRISPRIFEKILRGLGETDT